MRETYEYLKYFKIFVRATRAPILPCHSIRDCSGPATHVEEKDIFKVEDHKNTVETWRTDEQIKSGDEVVVE